MMETVEVTRYATPLREGGSLPGIVEASDSGTYVCKFRGAGQGVRVLVAEVIVSGLARAVGLRTPRLVALELSSEIARYEADEEVQDLLKASLGLNLGVDFLPGSFGFDGAPESTPGEVDEAALVLWLDAFTANVDRTWRNPNLLWWHHDLWLIDHGASLYFHHGWGRGVGDPGRFAQQAWDPNEHVFAEALPRLAEVHARMQTVLKVEEFVEILRDVPDDWLESPVGESPAQLRATYVEFLTARLVSSQWLPGAQA